MPTIGLAVQRAGRVGTIATNTQWPTHGVGRAQDNPNGFRGNLAGAEPKHGWGTPLTTPTACTVCVVFLSQGTPQTIRARPKHRKSHQAEWLRLQHCSVGAAVPCTMQIADPPPGYKRLVGIADGLSVSSPQVLGTP